MPAVPCNLAAGLSRKPIRHLVEPILHGIVPAHGGSFACQNQKRSLEDVLGILRLVQDTPANTHDQWAVPLHQYGESRFIPLVRKALEQLSVAEVPGVGPAEIAANVLQDRV